MQFDSLRLEAWSSARVGEPAPRARAGAEMRALSEPSAASSAEAATTREEEDAVPLTTPGGEELASCASASRCDYAHKQLVREFFEQRLREPRSTRG